MQPLLVGLELHVHRLFKWSIYVCEIYHAICWCTVIRFHVIYMVEFMCISGNWLLFQKYIYSTGGNNMLLITTGTIYVHERNWSRRLKTDFEVDQWKNTSSQIMQTFDCIVPRGSPKITRMEALGGTKAHRHSIFKMQTSRSDISTTESDIYESHALKATRHGMFTKYKLKPRSQSMGAAALQSSGIGQFAAMVRHREADSDSEMDTALRSFPNRPDSFK